MTEGEGCVKNLPNGQEKLPPGNYVGQKLSGGSIMRLDSTDRYTMALSALLSSEPFGRMLRKTVQIRVFMFTADS
jgi:hypothetical protein